MLLSFGTIDRGVLRTIIDLFIRPAHMAIEYIHGKRVTFFAPFQLLFILATLYMIIYYWSGETSNFTLTSEVDKVLSTEAQEFITKLVRFFQNNRGIMWAFCIPLQVMAFRLLYKQVRYRFTWVETCFIAAYFFSQIIIVELLLFIFSQYFPNLDLMKDDTSIFIYLFLLSFDLKQLTGGTWKSNILKCITGQIIFYTILGLLMGFAAIVAILTGVIDIQKSLELL